MIELFRSLNGYLCKGACRDLRHGFGYKRRTESVRSSACVRDRPSGGTYTVMLYPQARARDETVLTASIEMQNIADEHVYDYFGAERHGRAVYIKTTA
jgi:hypothetical protein